MEGEEIVVSDTSSPNEGHSGDELSDSSVHLPSSFISAQNYITIKEGCKSAFTPEELTKAIAHCKKLVLESEQCSEERKWLVRRLIELRHRLQEAEECANENVGQEDIETTRVFLGHHFVLEYQPTLTAKKYCDRCCRIIWHVIQSWYQCSDCEYKCHTKCIDQTNRVCAHLIISEKPVFEAGICPEVGLDAQSYQCFECHAFIIFGPGPHEAKKCDYSGKYYCSMCHWNNTSVIPARVIRNWDFEPRLVSRAAYQLIRHSKSKPIITLDARLYSFISELAAVKKLREEIGKMKHYISTCRLAIECGLHTKELKWRHHLIHSPDVYSLDDLLEINSGELMAKLDRVHDLLTIHIKVDCKVCLCRGHICPTCREDGILFPFDENIHVCPKCQTVQHWRCWQDALICPLCVKIQHKKHPQ